MPSWSEGYVSDIAYTANIYREQMPAWLGFASLLLGQPSPDLTKPFRMAELGCGHGMSLAVAAACSPHAEFFGFDFNPAHIESARSLVHEAGLANVHYVERAFADLLSIDLPEFDFIVMHGVWSWVTPEVRRAARDFIAAKLRAGGLVYNSYNVLTGWTSMVPLQTVMRLVGRGLRSEHVFPRVRQVFEQLRQGGASYLAVHERPLEPRLKALETLDQRYLAHEYLNAGWQPLMFADVEAEMADAKCSFIGSASLTDNINAASVPGGMFQLLQDTQDIALRETLRDLGNAQSFRRDIFRRGLATISGSEHMARAEAVVLEPIAPRPEGDITFPSSVGQIAGKPEIYGPIFDWLDRGSVTLAELHRLPVLAGKPMNEAFQAAALLACGSQAYPRVYETTPAPAVEAARRLNRAFIRRNEQGGNFGQLVAPALAAAIGADLIDSFAVGMLLDGAEADESALTSRAVDTLRRTGRTLQREGKPIDDPEALSAAARAKIKAVLRNRGVLERIGIL